MNIKYNGKICNNLLYPIYNKEDILMQIIETTYKDIIYYTYNLLTDKELLKILKKDKYKSRIHYRNYIALYLYQHLYIYCFFIDELATTNIENFLKFNVSIKMANKIRKTLTKYYNLICPSYIIFNDDGNVNKPYDINQFYFYNYY